MSAIPYVLLGSTRRAALQDALVGRLTSWRQRWSTANSAIAVNVPESLAAGWAKFTHGNGTLLSAGANDTALLHVHVAAGFLPALLGCESYAHEAILSAQDLTDQLRSEVLRSMSGALLQGVSADPAGFEADVGTQSSRLDAARKQRALPISVAFANSGGRCTLILHPRLVELLAPRRRASAGEQQLDRRQVAIASQTLHVDAVLAEIDLPFGELRSLASGDVIVLDKPLSEPAQLITETGAHVSAVALGSAGAKRAVQVTN
jgi:flagellar motor switch/type III secretory pathway protein FliN